MYWCFKKHMKKYLYKKIHIAKLWYIFLEERRFWCFREESAQDFSPRHLTKFNSRWVFFFLAPLQKRRVHNSDQIKLTSEPFLLYFFSCHVFFFARVIWGPWLEPDGNASRPLTNHRWAPFVRVHFDLTCLSGAQKELPYSPNAQQTNWQALYSHTSLPQVGLEKKG